MELASRQERVAGIERIVRRKSETTETRGKQCGRGSPAALEKKFAPALIDGFATCWQMVRDKFDRITRLPCPSQSNDLWIFTCRTEI